MIDRVKFKDTEVSRLGLGTMRLPCKTPLKREANPLIDYKKGQELVDLAYQNGVNYFDTAYIYHAGKSEAFIGSALKKYPRDTYFLADKLPMWMCLKQNDLERIFNKQLKRCDVDYFDFYLLHSLDKGNWEKVKKFNAIDFVEQKRKEGKVKYFGFSFHGTLDVLEEIVAAHDWDFAQIQMNYLDWKNYKSKEQYEILEKAGIPVIIMEPLRGGKLANVPKAAEEIFNKANPDKSIASWAIGYDASFDNVLTILSGMNAPEQMMDNINTLTDFKPYTQQEMNICYNAAAIINKNDIIPCTGCDYCADCPKNIKISTVFALYNKLKTEDISLSDAKAQYLTIDANANACIKCGKCKTHCPQMIDIPGLLNGKIKEVF
ncbi:MAG: aldo/keto reductase [Eubacterium sp.]|nr:aldo/keto reductase [Eubacterium sp.]